MERATVLQQDRVAGDPTPASRELDGTFVHLASRHLDRACQLATFILAGDRAEAEDAVQDAALRAWLHFDKLRDPALFEAWFTRIVVNACRDRLAARRVRPLTMSEPEPGVAPDHADRVVAADALARAMRALSPEHRIVVALRYLSDCSVEEIASRTGQRTGTVKSRLHYALRTLRAAFDADAREASR